MNLSPVRAPGESQQAYHERLKTTRKDRERRLRGKVLWTSCVLQNGKQMLKAWLGEHPKATELEIAAVTKLYPENRLFKVAISGTYKRKDAGQIGYEPVYGRKRILPSNRPRAIAARS